MFISKIRKGLPLLILLHGWEGSWQSWTPAIELLKRDFSLIVPDLPGFGKNKLSKPLALADYAKFVANLLKIKKIKKAVIIGHSFGGAVAAKTAIDYPQLVSKLILVDAALIRKKSVLKKFFIAAAHCGRNFFSLPAVNLLFPLARRLFYSLSRMDDSDYFRIGEDSFLKLTFSRIVEEDLTFQLNLIKTSTFIIWGGKDKETPLKEGKEIHRAIKNSKLLFFPGAGHFSYLDDLPKFCSEIKKFIYAP